MKALWAFYFAVILLTAHAAAPIEPPLLPSPIADFRKWLAQSPEERKVALATRPPQARRLLEQKLDEYTSLAPAERNRRLAATEVQWYVTKLIHMSASRRAAAITNVPALWQPMVLERLIAWDKLSSDLQKEALDHRAVLEYLSTPADQQQAVIRSLSPQEREALTERMARWTILAPEQRKQLDERVGEFFAMNREKQRATLNNFSDSERRNMQSALDAFRALSPQQRELCIRSFAQFADKFATMSRPEQIAFLKNAERWQEMSQKERDMWRKVVAVVPPMPPLPTDLPPLPSVSRMPTPRP